LKPTSSVSMMVKPRSEEGFDSENSSDSFSIAASEGNARLEFSAHGENSAAPRDCVTEP